MNATSVSAKIVMGRGIILVYFNSLLRRLPNPNEALDQSRGRRT